MMFFALISSDASRRRSSAAPLQSFPIINFQFSILHFQFKKFHPSNGKRTNELKYCFNSHSWALSLIMAWR